MTSHDKEEAAIFETVEDELKHLRESYAELQRKDRAVMSENLRHNCTEDSEMEEPPAKRQKVDDSSMDPLKRLDEPIANKIMKYLSPTELLQATEVSSGWKHFIESRKSLMDPAMRKITFKPSLEGCSLQLASSLFNDNQSRAYKQMECPLYLDKTFKICPIQQHAASLTKLKIFNANEDQNVVAIDGCEFPNLIVLLIKHYSIDIMNNCSFPSLVYLAILNFDQERGEDLMTNFDSLKKFLQQFPRLNQFWCLSPASDSIIKFYVTQEDPVNIAIEPDLNEPKIETIAIAWYYAKLMKYQQNSLRNLAVFILNFKYFSWLLRDLKVLKSLTVASFMYNDDDSEEEDLDVGLPLNSSIEILKITRSLTSERIISHQVLVRILSALPSLKELVLKSTATAELIRFLADNTINLKKFIYHEITDEGMQAYQEIQNDPNRYVNSTFELIQDADIVARFKLI